MQIIEVCLTCTIGTSNKYWHGRVIRNAPRRGRPDYIFESYYGRIGKPGQTSTKLQPQVFAAFKLLLAKVKEKVKKGYVFETSSSITKWSDRYEPDLKIAVSRFVASAKSLEGWINIPGVSDFVKSEHRKKAPRKGRMLKSKEREKPKSEPPSSIRKIIEERRRTAPIRI